MVIILNLMKATFLIKTIDIVHVFKLQYYIINNNM